MDTPESGDEPTTADPATPAGHGSRSLRGSFVAVLLMTAFFCAAWFGVLAIALERR